MFESILIANRGEIACRVIKTARAMGIRTVAVYSEADAKARHVRLADEAHLIGPPAARDSYLVTEKIIAAAQKSGAQAIHPGYGFLSENAAFADVCAKVGVTFIGPPADAIRAMGLKDAAKALMEKAGVPVVPGYHGPDQSDKTLTSAAKKIGFPLLIKAVAGGGGKGMRRVDSMQDFAAALEGARREAASAFGNDAVLIEKYVTKPRHVEIQVFADGHGNAVYLFERDCSLQRRHQKVIEEAPAPGMPEEMRRAMGEAAVKAALAIGYQGAGTVEFIVDGSRGLRPDGFYFMEMNTRLQVEHPVTEKITGQDLVEWQLRVAAGEPLPLTQDQLRIRGHAVEARLYAEDPARGFLPATGKLLRLKLPQGDAHVRVDAGVEEGDLVSVHYDPMIAKVIAWGETREAALRRLKGALQGSVVAGLTTNLPFLARIMGHAAFRAGDVDTGFIDRHLSDLIPADGKADDRTLALAALDHLLALDENYRAQAAATSDRWSPWASANGWRMNGETSLVLRFDDNGEIRDVGVAFTASGYVLGLANGEIAARAARRADGALVADLAGDKISAEVVRAGNDIYVTVGGVTRKLKFYDPGVAADLSSDAGGGIVSPMPGKVMRVMAKAGDKVKRGAPLLILEAMKMEHTLIAPADGVVKKLSAVEGEQVSEGAVLAVVEAKEE